MSMSIVAGLLIPFLGTTAGAACVFFLKKQIGGNIQRIFTGFAAGVMVAASVWSLLIPAMDMCEEMGKLAFLPAMTGFLIGIVFCCSSIVWFPICMWAVRLRRVIRAA